MPAYGLLLVTSQEERGVVQPHQLLGDSREACESVLLQSVCVESLRLSFHSLDKSTVLHVELHTLPLSEEKKLG